MEKTTMSEYNVYIFIDEENRIVDIDCDFYARDFTNWIFIDKGRGDKYRNPRINYFKEQGGLFTEDCIARYKYVNEKIILRSQQERNADFLTITGNCNEIATITARKIIELENLVNDIILILVPLLQDFENSAAKLNILAQEYKIRKESQESVENIVDSWKNLSNTDKGKIISIVNI